MRRRRCLKTCLSEKSRTRRRDGARSAAIGDKINYCRTLVQSSVRNLADSDTPIAQALAAALCALDTRALSDAVAQRVKVAFIDTVGCMLAGVNVPSTVILLDYLLADGSGGRASMVGGPSGLSESAAVLINGQAAHSLDYDDMMDGAIIHPSAVLVPVLLALAQTRGASGRELVEGYVAGLELGVKLARGLVKGEVLGVWHRTLVIGVSARSGRPAESRP